jgi:hypothetical protein
MADNSNSRARAYFEQFTGDAAADLLKGIPCEEPKRFEDEQLDFKSGRHQIEDLDEPLSKELGAFANNEGGVVVWGITASRDNERKLDFAHALGLAQDIEALKARILSKYRFMTDPPLRGVEVEAVPIEPGSTEGFVVLFIPEGDQKPYRSLKAKYPYQMRVGSDAMEISNSTLRQLFYPRYVTRPHVEIFPLLKPTFAYINQQSSNLSLLGTALAFGIHVKNRGNASLRNPFITVSSGNVGLWRTQPVGSSMSVIAEVNRIIKLDDMLHPEMTTTFHMLATRNEAVENISLELRIYSTDAPRALAQITIPIPFTNAINEECSPDQD